MTETTKFTDTHKQLVIEMMRLTQIDSVPERTVTESILRFKENFAPEGEEFNEEHIPDNFKAVIKEVEDAHQNARKHLIEAVVDHYCATFTEEEMQQIVTFYSMDTGKKIVERGGLLLPELMGVCTAWSMEVMKRVSPKLVEIAGPGEPEGEAPQQAKELDMNAVEAGTSTPPTASDR